MLKVLAICGNGMGTSLVIKMKVKGFLDQQGVSCHVDSCSLGEANGYLNQGYDVALFSAHLEKDVNAPERTHTLGLKNLINDKEFGPPLMKIVRTHFASEIAS